MDRINGGTTKKGKMDKISALPDSLICHILSFLPTETAVSTSLLSHRWRCLWQHLHDFDFELELDLDQYEQYDDDGQYRESFVHFSAFVNGVLTQRKNRDIRKFRLSCYTDEDSFYGRSLNYWLLAATGPQLQDLNLSLYSLNPDDFRFPFYSLPRGIFSCSSLVSFTLDGHISFKNISSVHLPALRTMRLSIHGAAPMDKIFSGCPVLEDLSLRFNVRNAPKLIVPNSLKRLVVNGRKSSTPEEVEVEIDAPALEHLSFHFDISLSRFTVKNLHNVVEARLNFSPRGYNSVDYIHRLLNALNRAKSLHLAPTGNSSSWIPPTRVPDCLASQLTKIEFTRYEGSKDELTFIAYILKNGLVLQTVTVHLDWLKSQKDKCKKKYNITTELCAIPRGSNMCQIEIKDSDIFSSGFE